LPIGDWRLVAALSKETAKFAKKTSFELGSLNFVSLMKLERQMSG
jgi:hypothetical protein